MRHTLYQYLLERPAGASPRELLDLVFTQPGTDAEFGPRFLHTLLAADARFAWDAGRGRWTLCRHTALAQPLSETPFVVLDLETTGTVVRADGIIEIGAVRIRAGRVQAEFQQLVNPGVRLPPFITRLTGITDALLAEQPPLAAVWPRLTAFLGDAVIVAHNARFDLGYLDAAAALYDGAPLPHPHLCTLKLARRLLPALRRRGLDALAAHFGIPQVDRHRALGDARITTEVFFFLLEALAVRGVVRLDQALDVQQQAGDGRRFFCPLPRAGVEQLPAAPGIYRLFGADGRLLYIGKAGNLRARVASYLSNAAAHSGKTLDLIRHSRAARVTVAGSPLEAALEEAAAIRREQPPYNRLGKHLPRIAFVKLAVADTYPRLSIATRLGAGRARYLGPFRHRREAEHVQAMLARLFQLRTCCGRLYPDAERTPCLQGQMGACSAPCAARVEADAYRCQVDACLRLLSGDAAEAERELIARRDRLAADLRFEAAGRAHSDLQLLQVLTHRQRTLGWITSQQHFVVLQPSSDRSVVLCYVVLGGRLALRVRLHDPAQLDALATQVGGLFPRYQRAKLSPDDVDGTTILAAWLRDRGEADGYVFRIENAAAPATQCSEWRAACAALLAVPASFDGHPLAPPAQPQDDRQRRQHPRPGAVSAAD